MSFSKVGTQTITFSISYKNGTKTTTYATIEVENDISTTARSIGDPCYIPPAVLGAGFGGNIEATIPFTGYEAGDLPILGRGDVGYYYSSNPANSKLCNGFHNVTKPIIFLDGFDALDKRLIPEIYNQKLVYAGGNFGNDIRASGYDLVILNFPNYITSNYTRVDGGTDYIERNAMVLVALIQNIKAQMVAAGSAEQITIVGPSMGGLISRYALAYMEKNGLNHNTKLWISFDAPHNGANIPIGSQKLLESLGGTFATAATKLETKLNNPATRQLLLLHYSSPVDKQSSYRNTFIANLTSNGLAGSNGFPKNLRKVAIINGALSGVERYGNASGDYMNIIIKKRSLLSLFGLLKHGLEFLTFFAPANNTVGKVRETKVHISGLLGLQAGQGNAIAYNGFASIDKVQGGWFNSSQEILDGFKSESIPFFGEISGNVSYPNLCFIPSKSGLAYIGTNTNFSEVMNNRSLVCSGETPFDAYYAPPTDEDHTSIGSGGAVWLQNELAGTPNQNLPTSNNNGASFTANILGSNIAVCPNTPTTYTLNTSITLPAGTTINWVCNSGVNS